MDCLEKLQSYKQQLSAPSERLAAIDKPTLSERAFALIIDENKAAAQSTIEELEASIKALKEWKHGIDIKAQR